MLDKSFLCITLYSENTKKGFIMNDTNVMQEIRDLEQKIQKTTAHVAELENKIQEHKVALSFNAVGATDVIYEYEVDMENLIKQQMSMKQKLRTLYDRVQIR